MKYPALLSFDQVLARLDRFDAIIDVRSPSEFALDHLPHAINCPVLDDAQRAEVGTLHNHVNAFEARKVGAPMVAKNVSHYIETLWRDKPHDWHALIYCWRGGNRSGAMAHILAKIGWPVIQLDGGYKAYRNYVNAALSLPPAPSFKVVCGTTGSGKTRLLEVLRRLGAQVLDLEQLAAHRGSVLGHMPNQPQPSQKAFEGAIWQQLRQFDAGRTVFVESESKKIGNLNVPAALMDKMRRSPCISLRLSRQNRVRLLLEDYAHFTQHPAALKAQLDCLLSLHGREKIGRWHALIDTAQMPELVEQVLADHYDPAYLRSIERNFALFLQADVEQLDGISDESYLALARRLHQAP